MSRAFVKEDEREEQPLAPSRAPLPEGAVNYVTPRGLGLLQTERRDLDEQLARESDEARQRALRARIGELELRLAGARLIDLHDSPPREARFGAFVRVRVLEGPHAGEEWESSLVGVDEADAATNRVSFYSPFSQAVVGRRAGERALVETEEGEILLEILSVRYEAG